MNEYCDYDGYDCGGKYSKIHKIRRHIPYASEISDVRVIDWMEEQEEFCGIDPILGEYTTDQQTIIFRGGPLDGLQCDVSLEAKIIRVENQLSAGYAEYHVFGKYAKIHYPK